MTDFQKPAGVSFGINATGDYYIGTAGQDNVVGRWIIHLVDTSSYSGSVVIKGRAAGTSLTPVAIPYTKRYLNGSVGDDSKVSTTITTTSIIDVDSTGLDIVVSVTYTSGTATVMALGFLG